MSIDDLGSATWITSSDGEPAAMSVRRVRLEVIAGPDIGLIRELEASNITIGARNGTDLTLDDRKVSGFHARIVLDQQGYRLRDLGSTNGTFVGGLRVNDVYIEPGTPILLGRTQVRFQPLYSALEVPLWKQHAFGAMVGRSPQMRRLFAQLKSVAASEATVLVNGETGTGKELVAQAIHENSPRRDGPLVVVDCGSISATLFESELFGHEKGAFTTALRDRAGAFERARGGSLYFDEIGELPLELQPKLLRALESKTVRRVGGDRRIDCDVRVVAATNRDLEVEVNRANFRADLYYRLDVARLRVPPLRERPEDIPLLVAHFVEMLAPARAGTLPAEMIEAWTKTSWPGNVRQLRNAVERATLMPDGAREGSADPALAGAGVDAPASWTQFVDIGVPFKEAKRRLIDAFDERYLADLLEAHDGNISAAARTAGVDRMTIYKLVDRYGRR